MHCVVLHCMRVSHVNCGESINSRDSDFFSHRSSSKTDRVMVCFVASESNTAYSSNVAVDCEGTMGTMGSEGEKQENSESDID